MKSSDVIVVRKHEWLSANLKKVVITSGTICFETNTRIINIP